MSTLHPDLVEVSPREPHTHRYQLKLPITDPEVGQQVSIATVDVDDHGNVIVSEEFLDQMLLRTGFQRVLE